MPAPLLDKIYGCLIGGAAGDALGAPVEGWNYWEIRQKYGKLDALIPSPRPNANQLPGGVTDDSVLRHYLALAIIQKGGRITPDDLAALWVAKGLSPLLWSNERIAYEKLLWGMNPWDAGRGANMCATGSMAIAPVGLINAGDPSQAYQDGFLLASTYQDGEERDAAGSLAAGVAAAFLPGATLDSIFDTMNRCSTYLVRRAIDLAFDAAARAGDMDSFTELYYQELADWRMARPPSRVQPVPPERPRRAMYYSGSSLELIPVALVVLHFASGDLNLALREAASFGRDCDTIATIAGCLGGALYGAASLRPDWVAQVEQANTDLFQFLEGDPHANFLSVAHRLVAVLENEKRNSEQRAALLGGWLAD